MCPIGDTRSRLPRTATLEPADILLGVDPKALRGEFPALDDLAYLNAGTDGPLPARAVAAARAELEREALQGRAQQHFERRTELNGRLRAAYASLLGSPLEDIALTTCTSQGLATVLAGLQLGPEEEILTSDEEHPGLLGALAGARRRSGVRVREVPLAEIPGAAGDRTRLIACSHVGWVSGSLAPAELAELEIPVLLDGAQGIGAIPVDVHALGCAAYAGAGQKWLCGPDGAGVLYVSPALRERLAVTGPGYVNLEDPGAGLDARPHTDARRFDTPALSAEAVACSLAAIEVLEQFGWRALHARAAALAAQLARSLQELGREVAPRARTTLVSFTSPDPPAERMRLAALGVILRDIPDRPLLRASVGAWNDERDLERLLDGLRPIRGS
jgi:selenocysteine lyase/cysteine desulfurase